VEYINQQLKYYRIAADPDALSDAEWTRGYAVLEHIRKEEAQQTWQTAAIPT
jgi:hypothetical protein